MVQCCASGDRNKTKIGRTSIQDDNVVIHADTKNAVQIEDDISVGTRSVLHGCRIKSNVIIEMNSTVLNGAEIGKKGAEIKVFLKRKAKL